MQEQHSSSSHWSLFPLNLGPLITLFTSVLNVSVRSGGYGSTVVSYTESGPCVLKDALRKAKEAASKAETSKNVSKKSNFGCIFLILPPPPVT